MSEALPPQKHKLDSALFRGVAWTAGSKWVAQVFSWISVVGVARLLSPSDFGFAEMSGFYVGLTNVLAEFGIATAVMQMRELDRKKLEQLNTVSVIFGISVQLVSLLVAPLLGSLFQSDIVTSLIRVSSITFLFTALQAVPMGVLQREMDYRLISVSEAVQALAQAAFTLGFALAGWSYWSLIAGFLAGKLVVAGMVIWWRPTAFARPHWQELSAPLRFGADIALSRLAWAFYGQADAIVVGRMLGESTLGLYRMAMNVASVPADKIGMLLMRVTGPLFARVQDDIPLTHRYLLRSSEALALTMLPLMVGLTVVAPEAVIVILGKKWLPAVEIIRWLAVFQGLRTLGTLMSQVLTALRLSRFVLRMSTISIVLMPVAFYLAARWGGGAEAVAACWLLLSPITILPFAVKLLVTIDMSAREYCNVLMPSLAASAGMVVALFALRAYIGQAHWGPLLSLIVQVATGGLVYGMILYVGFRESVLRYVRFLANRKQAAD